MMLRRLHMILSHSCHGNFGNFYGHNLMFGFAKGSEVPRFSVMSTFSSLTLSLPLTQWLLSHDHVTTLAGSA